MGESRFDEQDSAHSMFGLQKPEQAKAANRRREIVTWALMAAIVVVAIAVIMKFS